MAPMIIASSDGAIWQSVLDALCTSNRMVIITGAGISTKCGIPDFRSNDGLRRQSVKQVLERFDVDVAQYENQAQKSPLPKTSSPGVLTGIDPTDLKMKCAELFNDVSLGTASKATALYRLCALMHKASTASSVKPSQTHLFVREVQRQKRLQGYLTQNIDSIELLTGMTFTTEQGMYGDQNSTYSRDSECTVVQLHGDLRTVYCRICYRVTPWTSETTAAFQEGKVFDCLTCLAYARKRREQGLRATDTGVLRPNIVLYGEKHPQAKAVQRCIDAAADGTPDLLLVMGTSLALGGVRDLVSDVAKVVHQGKEGLVLYVNDTQKLGKRWDGVIDYAIGMDCDEFVQALVAHRPVQWRNIQEHSSPCSTLATRQQELHPRVRRLSRGEQDLVWLDTFHPKPSQAYPK